MLNASDPTYLDELHFEQHWHLDPTCNWKEFTQNVYTSPTSELIQQRTHNAVSELTDIAESTGAFDGANVTASGTPVNRTAR